MKPDLNRRDFLRHTATAAIALTAAPSLLAQTRKSKVTLALVGCAHIHTPGFVDLLKSRNDVTVKWVWDHDAARAEKRAQQLDSKVTKTVGDVWSDPAVDGVVICSETNRHHELVLAAAQARKHMFVEKPLGINARESFEMARAITDAKLYFTTGYFMRTDPKHLYLRDQVAQGNFGKITRARGSNCHSGSLGGWFDTEWRWMANPKIAGVGAFGDLGTHKLDILMWLLGDITSATASIKTVTGRYEDCDECGEGLMEFKNGTSATLAAGWVDIADPVQLLISGTEGHAVIFNDQLFYESKKAGVSAKAPVTNLPPGPKAPLHQFVEAVAGESNQPLVTPAEAAARVAAMEAMYKGANAGKWVKVSTGR